MSLGESQGYCATEKAEIRQALSESVVGEPPFFRWVIEALTLTYALLFLYPVYPPQPLQIEPEGILNVGFEGASDSIIKLSIEKPCYSPYPLRACRVMPV